MKKITILAAMIAVIALAGTAVAQMDPGDIGVFFDTAGTKTWDSPATLAPFPFYVLAQDLDGDIFGYEFNLTLDTANITVLGRTPNPETALDVGPGPDNWIVGTGTCISGAGTVPLVTYSGLIFAELLDSTLCLGPADPSTPALGGGPGWLKCDETLQAFTIGAQGGDSYPDGCAVLFPTGTPPVGNEQDSWGSLKAGFGE